MDIERNRLWPLALLALGSRAWAQEAQPEERVALHFQSTVATQGHPGFDAAYSGKNSLAPGAESATSVVTDLFGGLRLWSGAELWVEPESAGGKGLSTTLGVAAFPSGEVYRVGDPSPTVIPGRIFVRQTIGLGGGRVDVDAGPLQLRGSRDRDALVLTVGKVAIPDFADNNPLSNDPHTRFMSWGLWASAAYDYPADTRGYTWGAAADLSLGDWSLRGGIFLEPTTANGMEIEWRIGKARGLVVEGERRFGRAAVRLLGFLNDAPMGSYDAATAASVDVSQTRAFGRLKGGVAGSANADLGGGLSGFARASWSDGANETWAFTEIDRSVAAGVVQSGARWGRPDDEAGAAVVASGMSGAHRRYLASGQVGFLIGDGALRYGSEVLGELYYRAALSHEVSLGVNYQPILNPGFNRDRGPVHVFTLRAHVAF